MIEKLLDLDRKLFLFLNGEGSSILDNLMLAITSHWFWVPAYLFLVFYFIKGNRLKGIFDIAVIFLCLFITDQTSVHLFKEVFERLRPCHDPQIMDQVRLVSDNCGGKYGFVSSHATNSFGLAILSAGLVKKNAYSIIILIWALLTSYSRIYIGVHYPGDILGGILLGVIIGFLLLIIYKQLRKKYLKNATTKEA